MNAPSSRTTGRALVTGATGFVGGWLTRRLVAEGVEVRILKRSPGPPADELAGIPLDVRRGDVTDPDSVRAAVSGVDVVFHLAGLIAHSKAERAAMQAVNVEGTRNVVEACAHRAGPRLVHMSSIAALGASFDGKRLLTEASTYNLDALHLAYFETKRDGEALVLEAARAGRVQAVSINPGTVYGAGDARKGSRAAMLRVARGTMPFFPPGGVNVVDVETVVDALIAADRLGRSGERYLVGGENLLLKTVFSLIARESGVKAPAIGIPGAALKVLGRIGDWRERRGRHGPLTSEAAWGAVLFHWFDSSKARLEFGLRPRPAASAIAASVRWSREQGLITNWGRPPG